jgi:branched-chain amino acid transport system substrate-binding protein
MLQYAAEDLGRRKVCAIMHSQPGFGPAYDAAIASFEQATGRKLAYADKDLGATADPTPTVINASRAGCEAVVFTGIGPQIVAIMKAVQAQGLTDKIDWLALASAYTTDMPQALGEAGEGLYANSQFEVLDADTSAAREWAELMRKHDVPVSSFAQGGYLAARIFVEALRSIDGPITRDSVTDALHQVTAYESPLMGSPFSFAPGDRHSSNVSSRIVQVRDGAWEPVSDGFYRLEQ